MPWAPRPAASFAFETAARVSLLPAPASTGTLPASASVSSTTRRCSAASRVALSPVVPQGTRTSMPPSTCRLTHRRSAGSSSEPSFLKGVTRATPAPRNDRAIAASALPPTLLRAAGREVAQRPQLLTGVGGQLLLPRLPLQELPGLHPLLVHALDEQLDLPPRRPEGLRLGGGDVARLPGVLRAVEEGVPHLVLLGRPHDLEAAVPRRDEVAVVLGVEPLAVRPVLAAHRGPEALPREVGRVRDLDRVQQRGQEVERGGEERAPVAGLHGGAGDDERDQEVRVVQVLPVVEEVVVLPQALSVVRREHHERLRGHRGRGQGIQDASDLLIDRRDLSVVLGDVVAETVLTGDEPLLGDAAMEAGDRS